MDFYHIMTFVIGGIMAAMAGIIYAARLNAATPLAGQGYELDAIASCVIGGSSVSGGEGSIVGILIGVGFDSYSRHRQQLNRPLSGV